MKVAITGASGLVGTELTKSFEADGITVVPISRSAGKDDTITWSPSEGKLDAAALEGIDAVIHLAGDNIAKGRWNVAKKQRIRDSRVKSTDLLCRKLAELQNNPKVLVCASAIGFYGNQGDTKLSESAPLGSGYLAELTSQWERATEGAEAKVSLLRTGVVLGKDGRAWKKMAPPFKLGFGGKLGSGKQWMPWIHLADEIGATLHCLDQEIEGPVNLVAPVSCTNAEFTKALGSALNRPTVFAAPAFALKLALGDFAKEGLLASVRVVPEVLEKTGYQFKYETIEAAVAELCA